MKSNPCSREIIISSPNQDETVSTFEMSLNCVSFSMTNKSSGMVATPIDLRLNHSFKVK